MAPRKQRRRRHQHPGPLTYVARLSQELLSARRAVETDTPPDGEEESAQLYADTRSVSRKGRCFVRRALDPTSRVRLFARKIFSLYHTNNLISFESSRLLGTTFFFVAIVEFPIYLKMRKNFLGKLKYHGFVAYNSAE